MCGQVVSCGVGKAAAAAKVGGAGAAGCCSLPQLFTYPSSVHSASAQPPAWVWNEAVGGQRCMAGC